MQDYYTASQKCPKTLTNEWNSCSDDARTIMIKNLQCATVVYHGAGHLPWRSTLTTSVADLLAPESYNKLTLPKTGPCKVIKVSPTSIRIDGGEIRNTLSTDQATIRALAKIAKQQLAYTLDRQLGRLDERVDKGGG